MGIKQLGQRLIILIVRINIYFYNSNLRHLQSIDVQMARSFVIHYPAEAGKPKLEMSFRIKTNAYMGL